MPAILYTAQCPHCQEKLHWGETSKQTRDLPDRCPLCFEPLTEADRAALCARAEVSVGEESFDLPAEG